MPEGSVTGLPRTSAPLPRAQQWDSWWRFRPEPQGTGVEAASQPPSSGVAPLFLPLNGGHVAPGGTPGSQHRLIRSPTGSDA